jgi:hypothetical protein
MDNILSGLDKMGLNISKFKKLYEDEEVKENKTELHNENRTQKRPMMTIVNEEEYIFDKTYKCPLCGKEFKAKAVRSGRAKLASTDTDLKPVYVGFEPLKYDIVACVHCGYATTTKLFGHITPGQIKMVKESISANFKGITNSTGPYTFQEALDRHKLALANVMAMHGKNSERAYLCLKMAWLYRSMLPGIPSGDEKYEKLRIECKNGENMYLQNAYEGFSYSYSKEMPPICGMDITTLTYLLADLARRCKDYDNSRKYIEVIFNSKSANSKIKDRAREVKELLEEEMKNN